MELQTPTTPQSFEALRSELSESTAAFKSTHKTFVSNCWLSIAVALWITLIGLPSYWKPARTGVFGEELCTEADLLWKVEVNGTVRPYDEALVNHGQVVWCGVLPNIYLPNWPNLVQMIIFTVYQNTGTTIMQAWQGIIGTFCAVLNIYGMHVIVANWSVSRWVIWFDAYLFIFLVLASGAQENTMKFSLSWHAYFMMMALDPNSKPAPAEFPTGIPLLMWDQYSMVTLLTAVAGCLMAVLCTAGVSNYAKVVNDAAMSMKAMTKIWTEAIEYHCSSGPSARKYVVAEAITSLNSAVGRVRGNLANSWWETFDLFGYGKTRTLYMNFDNTLQKMGNVMIAVQDSVLSEEFGNMHNVFCLDLRWSMMNLKNRAVGLFEQCHRACQDGIIDASEIEEIKGGIQGVIYSQLEMFRAYNGLAKTDQADPVIPDFTCKSMCLPSMKGPLAGGVKMISKELSNETEFIFALSVWARMIRDLAENTIKLGYKVGSTRNSCCRTLFNMIYSGLFSTWKPPSSRHLLWTVRNFIPISIAFWVGYNLPCPSGANSADGSCSEHRILSSVFTPFDANMASTLGILINHYPGSALANNIKRLLGVTLGKIIPIVILGLLNLLHSAMGYYSLFAAMSIFYLAWFTNYMYYTSQNWSTVGCLIAAFGCAKMSQPRANTVQTDYNSNYKDIAQVIIAIILQISCDTIFDCLQNDWPRDAAVKKIGLIREALIQTFEAFFTGNLADLKSAHVELDGLITKAKSLIHEADPQMELVPCSRTPFKIDLYKAALRNLELISSDLTMLEIAVTTWCHASPPRDGNDTTATDVKLDANRKSSPWTWNASDDSSPLKNAGSGDKSPPSSTPLIRFDAMEYMHGLTGIGGPGGLRDELRRALEVVFTSLEAMLGYGGEDNNFQDVEQTKGLVNLCFAKSSTMTAQIFEEINSKPFSAHLDSRGKVCEDPRAKVTVAVRSLMQAKVHIVEIERLMMPYIML